LARRSQRGYINTKEVLQKLKQGRDGAIKVHREAKINGPEYQAASRVTEAIDDLAEELTGDRAYFHMRAHN